MPSPPPGWPSWEAAMREALAEAAKARRLGEIPVGALVIAPSGDVAGRGHNAPIAGADPTAHAEITAIRQAAAALGNYRLAGCVLAVTLEPCFMCAGAIVHARLAGVVFGAYDRKAGAIISRLEAFEEPCHNHRPWHAGGVLESDCAAMLRDFFAARRTRQP